MAESYEPKREIQKIHDDHGYCIAERTQDDFDRWQLDLLYQHLDRLSGEDKARAERTIKQLKERISSRRADEIDLDPIVTARACIERLKARAAE